MRTRMKSGSVAAAVALILSLNVSAANAQASAHIELPAQPLSEAIRAVARQASVNILVDPRLVEGRQAPAIKSQSSVRDALSMLLEGTGLTPKYVDDKTITLVEKTRPGADAPAVNNVSRTTVEPGLVRVAQVENGIAQREASDSTDLPSATDNSLAQQQTRRVELEEVIVTGSHIRGAQKLASPVVTIDPQQIRESGHQDLGEVVRSLPLNFSGGQNPGVWIGVGLAGTDNQNVTSGSSLNLRGLGADASLTLLNGRRLSYDGAGQAVDISAIPLAAVERVEVVPDGASAIYGSDAVAGVANVILKRDYDGVSTTARIGTATEGGGDEVAYGIVGGQVWRSGGIIAAYDNSRQDAIYARERDYLGHMFGSNTMFPETERHDALLSGHQELSSSAVLRWDVLYNESGAFQSLNSEGLRTDYRISTERYVLSPTLDFQLPSDWSVALNATYAEGSNELDNRSRIRGGLRRCRSNGLRATVCW